MSQRVASGGDAQSGGSRRGRRLRSENAVPPSRRSRRAPVGRRSSRAAGRLRVFDARATGRCAAPRRARGRRDLRGFSPAEELAGHHGRRGRRRPAPGTSRAPPAAKPGRCQHTFRWHQHTEGARSRTSVTDVAYAPCGGRLVVLATADHLGNSGAGSYRMLVWSAATGRLCTWRRARRARHVLRLGTAFREFHGKRRGRAADAATLARERRRRRALEENVVVTACEGPRCAFGHSGVRRRGRQALRVLGVRGGDVYESSVTKRPRETSRLAATTGAAEVSAARPSRAARRRAWRAVARRGRSARHRARRRDGPRSGRVFVRVVEAWSLGAAQRACAWAPSGGEPGSAWHRAPAPKDLASFLKQTRARNARNHDRAHARIRRVRWDGPRVARRELDARLDAVSRRDPDEASSPPSARETRGGAALPASTLVGVSGERVSLALEAFGGENSTKAR